MAWSIVLMLLAIVAPGLPAVSAIQVDEKAQKQPLAVEKLLDLSRDDVRTEIGKPDRTGKDFDSFFKAGLVVDYNEAGKAIKVEATRFESGDVFGGKVLGVALGDSTKNCTIAWGDSVRTEPSFGFEYEKVTWNYEGYALELEVWARDGLDKGFGKYLKGTVKQIAVAMRARSANAGAAEHAQNLKICLDGRYPALCKRSLLSSEEAQRATQAEQRAAAAFPAGAGHASPRHRASGSCESGHSIEWVSDDGEFVKLEDGSVWEVNPVDTINSALWLPVTEILVCDKKLINLTTESPLTRPAFAETAKCM